MTLRHFCELNGFDPGNISKLERGILPPPRSEDKLNEYASALNIKPGNDEYLTFFDLAMTSKIRASVRDNTDSDLLNMLPVLFRTVDNKDITPEKLERIIELIKEEVRKQMRKSDSTIEQHAIEFIETSPIINLNIHVSSENLKRIKQILKPSISELALLFGVFRQTIYNWQKGEEPSIEHVERIVDLAKVADLLADEGSDISSYIFRRKFLENKSLFDIAYEEGSLYPAAQKLVNILRIEATQRKLLNERLARRKPQSQKSDYYGTPM